ncbi:MAG TPA: FAD-dependent monooxygenase [Steroidobacteraceae bacterium]|jgi:3-(3-hydroxy-phenyl)propionate hydroxylase/6-hydroxy-3-succinoylpyridine 3-monooxygenase
MEDVIVVGGGPTGFITALGLAQAGVRVTVIESETKIVDSPRAAVYHWTVLEGLERLGIRGEVELAGFAKQDYTYLVGKTGERIEFSLDVLNGRVPFPYNLHLGQHRLAEIALRRLAEHSQARVRFNVRLVNLLQDENGVTLHVMTPDGPEQMRAKWVVGADGAASTVRQQLALEFEGMTWPERFVATNAFCDFERHRYARATFLIDEVHGAVIAKLDNSGLWRCTYMEDASLPEESFLQRLPLVYEAILHGVVDYTIERAAPYRMHQRSAPRYRVGRVVLAGDAAHVTNPTGGLGLTSGLLDSFALYPALAAVVLDGADPGVLDRYSEARREIFLKLVSPQAVANKRLVFHANGGGKDLEDTLVLLRRLPADPEFLLQRLMFLKSLETPPLLAQS